MSSISAASLAEQGVRYASSIWNAAREYGLDPGLLAAVAAQETGGPDTNGGRNIVGDGGHGHGLFQIDDRYHGFARTPEALDPARNAGYAARMLSGLIRRYGSVRRALCAYNAGDPNAEGTVTRWRDGADLGYADSVLRHEALITGHSGEDLARGELPASIASIQGPAAQAALLPLSLPQAAHLRSFRDLAGIDDGGRTRDANNDTDDS
ncbi:MAG TPA: transglycosylase SLT domain-containing protein [Candidatus Tyrphobacter sp.]